MAEKEIKFIGLLANVDSTIKQFDFKNGFQIESISQEEGLRFFSQIEGLPQNEVMTKLCMYFPCLSEGDKQFYFLSKTFEGEGEHAYLSASSKANQEHVHYLDPVIRLLRLFKEGNVCMPIQYYVSNYATNPTSGMRTFTTLPVMRESYSLKDVDMLELNRFVEKTTLPFKQPFVQLGFENFELSYQTHSPALSFLSLMMGLETLFNPAESEVRHRVSRNAAVLLGKDSSDSKKILSEVLALYRIRSKLIHAGDVRIVSQEPLLELRRIMRESVKAVNASGLSKEQLMEDLDAKGLG